MTILSFFTFSGDEPNTWELMLGTHQELGLNVSVSNRKESAYETQLFVVHPASISYIGRKVEVSQ